MVGPVTALKTLVKRWLMYRVERRWRRRTQLTWRGHGLGDELIISLTSYPGRYPTLALTLKCLLTQTVRADRVILWLAPGDLAALPPAILALRSEGLDIRPCVDHRSYNKIIPALEAFPRAFIATADDDLYYWPHWLEELVAARRADGRSIPCHRAHGIRTDIVGLPIPYGEWQHNIRAGEASPLVFPTGVGGVLYGPRMLHADVVDSITYRTLSPTNDDIWLYFMAQRQDFSFRKVGRRRRIVTWPGSQGSSLRTANVPKGGANDRQIAAMITRYGFPPT